MATLGDLIRQRRNNLFVNRENEQGIFQDFIAGKSQQRVLAINGVGGIGKTLLLERYIQICKQKGMPSVYIDGGTIQSVLDIMFAFRSQLLAAGNVWSPLRKFSATLDKVAEITDRLYEACEKEEGTHGVVIRAAFSAVKTFVPLTAPLLDGIKAEEKMEQAVKNILQKHFSRSERELFLKADSKLTVLLTEGLNAIIERKQHLVLMFDTYESFTSLDAWVRDQLLANLSDRVVFVVAGRQPLGAGWQTWKSLVREISLINFSSAEAQDYLRRRQISEEQFIVELFKFTSGHPLSLAMCADIEEEQARLSGVHSLSHSERFLVIKSLLTRILGQIDETSTMVLECCAVLRTFDQDLLQEMLPDIDMRRHFLELYNFSFVQFRHSGYALHDLVREYLLEDLQVRAPDRYAQLHERALAIYEKRAAYVKGRQYQKAIIEVVYYTLALDENKGVFLFRGLFENAVRLYQLSFCEGLLTQLDFSTLEQDTNRDWAEYYHGMLASRRGQWSEQEQICERLYQKPGLALPIMARVGIALGAISTRRGRPIEAVKMLLHSLEVLRRYEEPQLEADVLFEIGKSYRSLNQWSAALEAYQQAYSHFEREHRTSRMAESLMHIGVVHQLKGDFQTGLHKLQQSIAIFSTGDNEYGLSRALFNTAWVYMLQGDWETAVDYCERSLDLSQSLGVNYSIASILLVRANLNRLLGQIDIAERLLEESYSILRELNYHVYLGMYYQFQGLCKTDLDQLDQAVKSLTYSQEVLEKVGATAEAALTLYYLGDVQYRRGDFEQAKIHYHEVLKLVKTCENAYAEAWAQAGLCLTTEVQGQTSGAEMFRRVTEQAALYGYRDVQGMLALVRVINELRLGKLEAAGSAFADALLYAAAYHARYPRTLVRHLARAGRTLVQQGHNFSLNHLLICTIAALPNAEVVEAESNREAILAFIAHLQSMVPRKS